MHRTINYVKYIFTNVFFETQDVKSIPTYTNVRILLADCQCTREP